MQEARRRGRKRRAVTPLPCFLRPFSLFCLNVMEKSTTNLKSRDRGLCKFHVNSEGSLEDILMC